MSKNYDILYIQQYLEGRLSAKDMHQLELDALEDAMLQDAIEGFRLAKPSHRQLSLLQQRLEARIEEQQIEKNRFFFTGQRLAVASVAGVMLIVFSVLFWMMSSSRVSDQAAKLETGQSEVVLQIQDKAKATLVTGSIIPEGGWNDFRDYLSVHGTKIASGEEVRLYIEVVEGRPQNIKVLSSSSEQASNEVVRLLLEGPSWKGESGEVLIDF